MTSRFRRFARTVTSRFRALLKAQDSGWTRAYLAVLALGILAPNLAVAAFLSFTLLGSAFVALLAVLAVQLLAVAGGLAAAAGASLGSVFTVACVFTVLSLGVRGLAPTARSHLSLLSTFSRLLRREPLLPVAASETSHFTKKTATSHFRGAASSHFPPSETSHFAASETSHFAKNSHFQGPFLSEEDLALPPALSHHAPLRAASAGTERSHFPGTETSHFAGTERSHFSGSETSRSATSHFRKQAPRVERLAAVKEEDEDLWRWMSAPPTGTPMTPPMAC